MGKERVALKDIDLDTEIYVHYHKNNFVDYRDKYVNLNEQEIQNSIRNAYLSDAQTLRNRMNSLRAMTNKEGQSVASVLGLMNDINNGASNNETEQAMTREIPELLRKGLTQTYAAAATLSNNTNIDSQLSLLDSYINTIKQIITLINKNDEDYLKYILEQYGENKNVSINIQNLFSTESGLSLLAINQTAVTSFKSLSSSISKLEEIRNSISQGENIKKITNFKGKEVSYSSFIYPLYYLFSNILGGIGEGVGATYTLLQLEKFMKSLENENMKVTMEGTGTGRAKNNKVNKADYTISIDNENGTVNLDFGVSAKAQLAKSGKKITTTFETTTLGQLITILNNVEKYIFYNTLYFGMNDNSGYLLRRKIAAENLLNSITGIKNGENVLFIQYLDSIVGVDELFELLSKAPISNLPTISISNVKDVSKKESDYIARRSQLKKMAGIEEMRDLNPEDKNVLAWARSRQIISNFNKLATQIQYVH